MLDAVQSTPLANGLRVVSSRLPGAESAIIGLWIGVGGRHEPARACGASHFIEHLLFKGTGRRSARQISQAVEGRGGDLNAFTQEDHTCLYARLPHEWLDKGFDVLADMYAEPRLAPDEVERERAVILEELRMYRDQPQSLVHDRLQEAVWQGHALGRPLTGTERSLARLTRTELDAFHRRHYVPSRTVLAFAGRVDHARCVALAERTLGRLPRREAPACRRVDDRVPQGRVSLLRRDIEQVHAVVGFRTFGRRDPRRHALRALNAVLGENMSSRLFQLLRERHGLAYAVQSSYQLFDDTGLFTISAGLERARAGRALAIIARELVRLRDEPVPPAEWRRMRDYLTGQFRLGLESASSQMNWIGETLLQQGRVVPPGEVLEHLAAVRPPDVQRLAGDLFAASRMTLSLVVPREGREDEAAYLSRLATL